MGNRKNIRKVLERLRLTSELIDTFFESSSDEDEGYVI